MATSALVDAGFLVALLSRRDGNHAWPAEQASRFPPPWMTCEEAVLSETFHLLAGRGTLGVASLVRRGVLICNYRFADHSDAVLRLLEKYSQVPMSFADACLVRMTEVVNDPTLLTTDDDFRIYRRPVGVRWTRPASKLELAKEALMGAARHQADRRGRRLGTHSKIPGNARGFALLTFCDLTGSLEMATSVPARIDS
jgi:predicted nucleic acid-binding protein